MEFSSSTHKLVALFFLAFAIFCFFLPFFRRGASPLTERKFKWRERGRAEAQLIGETVDYVGRLFAGRYMPVSLCQLVAAARQSQRDLLRSSWLIENRFQMSALIGTAVAIRDRLVVAASAPFSAEAQEADRLALIAQLADAEARAVAEAAYVQELARVSSSLESERTRIAETQVRLAALAG